MMLCNAKQVFRQQIFRQAGMDDARAFFSRHFIIAACQAATLSS
jgi:hypothetical protein